MLFIKKKQLVDYVLMNDRLEYQRFPFYNPDLLGKKLCAQY